MTIESATSSPPADRAASLTMRGVSRVFAGGVRAVDPMDLSISAGDFVAILGPSGCGKSTLLRMASGLDHPTGGSLLMDGRPAGHWGARRPEDVAFVFQDAHLLPWRRVLANVALPLELTGVSRSNRHRIARGALEMVGLGDAIGRYPAQLSGGMRMRVSLARAMVTKPKLLLLDEPFAALDEITRQELDDQLRELWVERGMTVLFVTHSIAEATYLAERAIVLSPRPAKVVCDRRIGLPRSRTGELRTSVAFAGEARELYHAMHGGSDESHDASQSQSDPPSPSQSQPTSSEGGPLS